jgi:hypothetical protein
MYQITQKDYTAWADKLQTRKIERDFCRGLVVHKALNDGIGHLSQGGAFKL